MVKIEKYKIWKQTLCPSTSSKSVSEENKSLSSTSGNIVVTVCRVGR